MDIPDDTTPTTIIYSISSCQVFLARDSKRSALIRLPSLAAF